MKKEKKTIGASFSLKTEKKKINNVKKEGLLKKIKLSNFSLTCVYSLAIFSLIVVIVMIGYNYLFTKGSTETIQKLATTITNISDMHIEEYEELLKEIENEENIISQTIPMKISQKQELGLRILLNIRNDIDHVYYFKDSILYEINSLGTNKINENNTIYKFFVNNFEDGVISDWLYDSDSNKYLKIVPIKFENYSVGISYKVDDTSVLYKNIINMFSDIKVSFNSDDKVLYERVNDSEFNKALSKDNELFTYTDEEGNKISLFDSIKENIYKIIDDFEFLDKKYDRISSFSNKANYTINFQIGKIIDFYNLRIIEVAFVIFAIFIALAYIYANNIDTRRINSSIICYISIALSFLITFDVILRYTDSYEMMRGKELLGDALLLENNISSDYNFVGMEDMIGADIFNERLNDSTYDYIVSNMENAFRTAYNEVDKDSFDAKVALSSNLCPESSYKFEELLSEMNKCKGSDSYIDENTNLLHIVKYSLSSFGDNKIIVKYDLGLSKKILGLQYSINDRKPNVYIAYKNKVYHIDSTITESDMKLDYGYNKYTDTIYMFKGSSTHNVMIKDNNMGFETHLFYKINTTTLEYIVISIVSILEIGGMVFIFMLTLKKEKTEKKETKKNIYGEITYYNTDELEKKMLLTEELNKLKEQEQEEIRTYASKRRKHFDINDDSQDDDRDDTNLNVQNNKEKMELKQLGIFKTNKEIYQRYLLSQHDNIEQYASDERKDIVSLSEEEKNAFAEEAEKLIDNKRKIQGITLEEANVAYRRKKESQKDVLDQKNLRASIHQDDDQDEELVNDNELLSESKDEGFIKILDGKFKDIKK